MGVRGLDRYEGLAQQLPKFQRNPRVVCHDDDLTEPRTKVVALSDDGTGDVAERFCQRGVRHVAVVGSHHGDHHARQTMITRRDESAAKLERRARVVSLIDDKHDRRP